MVACQFLPRRSLSSPWQFSSRTPWRRGTPISTCCASAIMICFLLILCAVSGSDSHVSGRNSGSMRRVQSHDGHEPASWCRDDNCTADDDTDGDGWRSCDGDCDSTCGTINPGATEICNGVDDNCNGAIDEGFDEDGDGWTTCAGDCDDAHATCYTVNPGVTEICNGVDDNCNGLIDEGFDEDEDGWTTCAGDCDDTNAAVNPGANETSRNCENFGAVPVNECMDQDKANVCDHLAYCIDTEGSFECQCPEGFLGDGFSCSNNAWAIRTVIQFDCEPDPSLSSDQFRLQYARALSNATQLVDNGSPLVETLSVAYLEIVMGNQVTLNALYPTQEAAAAALSAIELELIDWTGLFGSCFEEVRDGPKVYRWNGQSTSDPIQIAPSGFTVESVFFDPTCLNSGCWVLDVVYTIGENDINAFYLAKAEGDDQLSYDFDYSVVNTDWRQSPADTFFPSTHPCSTATYDGLTDLPASASACCLKQFTAMYRPIASFSTAVTLATSIDTVCGTGLRDRTVDKSTVSVLSTGAWKTGGGMGQKSVFVDGVFEGMVHSYGESAGVIDPYAGIYKAKFYLDEVELRTLSGQLRGTVGAEFSVDMFLGLINLSPTGSYVLDTFATQFNIHLEKTNFFSVSTQGTNDYTFLEYVNMRLVAIYTGSTLTSLESDKRSIGAANYIQVTFTLGDQYEPNTNPNNDVYASGLIPLNSVRAGRGTFLSTVQDAGGMEHVCQEFAAVGDEDNVGLAVGRAGKGFFEAALERDCGPKSAMCASPSSIPDKFVSFNIPLGKEIFNGQASNTASNNIFVDFVINALDTDARDKGTTPNSGEDPWQVKTTLSAAIPIVDGGVNIFCDGITKTDLKKLANADIIVGSAMNARELSRLRIVKNIASTRLDVVERSEINTDSIESALMTLVLMGNASYFSPSGNRNTGGYSLELEDLVTIHLMEDGDAGSVTGGGASNSKEAVLISLLQQPPEDNVDLSGLGDADGYRLNGAFRFDIDRASGVARLMPTEELLDVCPFRATRPESNWMPIETCLLRADVRHREFAVRNGADGPTAMEILAQTGAPVSDDLESEVTALEAQVGVGGCGCDASSCCEAGFLQSILGENAYARELAVGFAKAVRERYNLNGRWRRAFWINPGYEWTPRQTGGRSRFSVSQKLYVFALISLDENLGRSAWRSPAPVQSNATAANANATAANSTSANSSETAGSRRRMLVVADPVDATKDTGSGAGAARLQFRVSQTSIMAQAYNVPLSKIAYFAVTTRLQRAHMCLPEEELRAALASTLNEYLAATTSAYHTGQIVVLTRDMGGEVCKTAARRGGGRKGRRPLQDLDWTSATASVELLVVFKEEDSAVFNADKFAAMPGILSVALADAANADVTLDSNFKSDSDDTLDDSSSRLIAGISAKLFIAIVAGGGLFGCLAGAALVLLVRRRAAARAQEEMSSVLVFVSDPQNAKTGAQLLSECTAKSDPDLLDTDALKPDVDPFYPEKQVFSPKKVLRFQYLDVMGPEEPRQDFVRARVAGPAYSSNEVLHHLAALPSFPSLPSLTSETQPRPRPPTVPPPRAPPRPSLLRSQPEFGGAPQGWETPAPVLPQLPVPVAHFDCTAPSAEEEEELRADDIVFQMTRTFWKWMQSSPASDSSSSDATEQPELWEFQARHI